MTLTIPSNTKTSISLEEYIDFCDSEPDLQDRERVIAHAGKLRELSNNRRFLAGYFNEQMRALDRFQEGNDFKPSTFILHRGRGYAVRAVVWLPDAEADNPEIFSYYETHDHNFDFLTCGYHGPGYRTLVYRYDHDRVVGYTGEPVTLEFVEDTTLPVGKLMYYFASEDVHTQLPPASLSISLNLILPRPEQQRRAQYEFDASTSTVRSRFVDMRMRSLVFSAVRHVGDDNSLDILSTLARRHDDPRTRALAWETLLHRRPASAEEHMSAALSDPSPLVRELTRRAHELMREPSGTTPYG